MIHRYEYKDTTWIDLQNPTGQEIRSVIDEYDIDPTIAEELSVYNPKSKVEISGEGLYTVLHFPAFKHSHTAHHINQEIDFIIGPRFVITTHKDTVDALHKFSKMVETDSILNKKTLNTRPGFLFFRILHKMYGSLFHELSSIEDWLQDIEKRIFEGKEREMVFELSHVSRNLLNFKKMTSFHAEILTSLELAGGKLFGKEFSDQVYTIRYEYERMNTYLSHHQDSVSELRRTNNALLETKQNEIIKVLTVITFIGLPLTIITSIFQIPAEAVPLIGMQNGFWIILGSLFVVTIGLFAIFKYKKWL